MAVNNSDLAAGRLPLMPKFASWVDCFSYLYELVCARVVFSFTLLILGDVWLPKSPFFSIELLIGTYPLPLSLLIGIML